MSNYPIFVLFIWFFFSFKQYCQKQNFFAFYSTVCQTSKLSGLCTDTIELRCSWKLNSGLIWFMVFNATFNNISVKFCASPVLKMYKILIKRCDNILTSKSEEWQTDGIYLLMVFMGQKREWGLVKTFNQVIFLLIPVYQEQCIFILALN